MKRWPCDVCGDPVASVGESHVLCPRAHRHHVCVDCQRLIYGKPYVGIEIKPSLDPGHRRILSAPGPTRRAFMRHYWLKQARCPADISDADRSMWSLAGPKATPASGTWEDIPTAPI